MKFAYVAAAALAVGSIAPAYAEKSVSLICSELQRPVTGLMTTTLDDKAALERLGAYNKITAQKLSATSAATTLSNYDDARAALVVAMQSFVSASERLITELQKCAR